jgi:hypothetical protein
VVDVLVRRFFSGRRGMGMGDTEKESDVATPKGKEGGKRLND